MHRIKVYIKRKPECSDLPLPRYMSDGASGADLCAAVDGEFLLNPCEVRSVPTGIYISLPKGYEAQVRPRSGLALRHSVAVLNSPGTVDCDYRGEICVILCNLGKEPFRITRGMRIAQLIVQPVVQADFVEVEDLDVTQRGHGGFGHTGH